MATREIFSSRFATLLTMVGVAVGLGNVWRFPYMMGRYGGSAFLFVYLLFTLLFAVPALSAEWSLGRATRRGPVGAFTLAFGRTPGLVIGWILLITVLVADSYYLVVIAKITYTAFISFAQGFGPEGRPAFEAGLANGSLQYAIAIGLLIVSLLVIHRGLRKGIETASKAFVPLFGAIVIVLVVYALSLPGALERLAGFLRPDFSLMGAEQIFAALGQVFFSAGLGGTLMLVYGSYLREDEAIPSGALATVLGDAGAALLASLFIVPTILVFGLDMTAGPHLIFATLPELFEAMPGGRWVGGLFLTALLLVAFLSNIAALEVLVSGLGDIARFRLERKRIILLVLAIEAAVMLPSAIHPPLIAHLDLIFGSVMQVFGSCMAALAITWGLGRGATLTQLFGGEHRGWRAAYFEWLRFVVPGALIAILAGYVYSKMM